MAIDPILGAGYLPRASEYRASVSGDTTNLNLELVGANNVRTLTITVPATVRIDLAQLDLRIVGATVNNPVTYSVLYNGSTILIGVCNSDPALIPLVLYQGPIGTIFSASNQDIFTLRVAGNPGAGTIVCAGGLSLFGTFI